MTRKKTKRINLHPASLAVALLISGSSIAAEEIAEEVKDKKPPAKNAKEAASVSKAPKPTELQAVTVVGKAIEDPNDPTNTEYKATNASTATKTDTPVLETPGSINVVTKQSLRDRQVFSIGEAFRYTSGVNSERGSGRSPFSNALVIRGFNNVEPGDLGGFYFRDGFRMSGVPLSIANLDRLELLKGPASVLFGQSEPGGLVNAVYKRPQAKPYYSLEQRFGSYDFYQTNLDATGRITKDDTLLYRLNTSYIDQGSFRDFLQNSLFSIAPSLTWNINERAQLTAQFEYNKTEWNFPHGIPAIGNRPAPIPFSRTLIIDPANGPDWQSENYITNLDFKYQVNDAWQLHWVGLSAKQDLLGTNPIGIADLDEATGQVTTGFQVAEPGPERQWWFTSLNVTGNVPIFKMNHKLLFGFDYNHEESDLPFFSGSSTIDFNIFNPTPNQGGRRLSLAEIEASGEVEDFFLINRRYGIYIQDQIELSEQLRLVLGGRFDDVDFVFDLPGSQVDNASALTPRYGLVYQPWPWLSTYYQYVESFGNFSSGRSSDGSRFALPQSGRQHEAGVKAEFFDGRLISTLAFYQLTRGNLSIPDPLDQTAQRPIGEARSEGIELDITGSITEHLNLIASYSYTDARITRSGDTDEGNRLPNVAEHMGSLWATYDITPNFKIGTGVVALGQRQGDTAGSFQLPGYARVDATAAYSVKLVGSKLTAQVNINNLFDKDYFASSTESRVGGALPGDPLTVIGSLRLEYF